MALGADTIATGHYARVRKLASGTTELLKAADAAKDQTYFLHRLDQRQLAPVLFPLAEVTKREVRAIARREGIPTWAKKDSTGICFIGERPFRDFLARYLPRTPGPIETTAGRVVGTHHGLAYYTLGQRQGLGIGGIKTKGAQRGGGEHAPWFVARKDVEHNTLWVVQGHEHPWLRSGALDADDASWIAGSAPHEGTYGSKTRYRQPDAPCVLARGANGAFHLDFPQPQWAVTPGQSAVLYAGDVCLGGGVISART
jgi:tRNA-specific 2-thiouridylase